MVLHTTYFASQHTHNVCAMRFHLDFVFALLPFVRQILIQSSATRINLEWCLVCRRRRRHCRGRCCLPHSTCATLQMRAMTADANINTCFFIFLLFGFCFIKLDVRLGGDTFSSPTSLSYSRTKNWGGKGGGGGGGWLERAKIKLMFLFGIFVVLFVGKWQIQSKILRQQWRAFKLKLRSMHSRWASKVSVSGTCMRVSLVSLQTPNDLKCYSDFMFGIQDPCRSSQSSPSSLLIFGFLLFFFFLFSNNRRCQSNENEK